MKIIIPKCEEANFRENVASVSFKRLKEQRSLIHENRKRESHHMTPFTEFVTSGNPEDQILGEQLVSQGKYGCLLVAGGQGTRLKFNGPKGCYPLSVIRHKSLFQIFSEKIVAASQRAKRPLPFAIMTSQDNDEETRRYFSLNNYFGLDKEQLFFFTQESLPLLDENENIFLKTPSQIASGADGNGHSLLQFAKSGLLEKWKKAGVEHLHFIIVDNALADPFDAELIGFHNRSEAEITMKCIMKLYPEEKVGLVVKEEGKPAIVEYSEISQKEKEALDPTGQLKYRCANMSQFCFSFSFIEKIVQLGIELPLHKSWKASEYLNAEGETQMSLQPIAWKFETFIFDWLKYADKVHAIVYPRESSFAPLKNFSGDHSPELVKEALQKRDREIFSQLTKQLPPIYPFELSLKFYYPTSDLIKKWHHQKPLDSYIE